jgi:hypothetical protein
LVDSPAVGVSGVSNVSQVAVLVLPKTDLCHGWKTGHVYIVTELEIDWS